MTVTPAQLARVLTDAFGDDSNYEIAVSPAGSKQHLTPDFQKRLKFTLDVPGGMLLVLYRVVPTRSVAPKATVIPTAPDMPKSIDD